MIKNVHGFIFGKLGDKYITKKEDKDGHILIVGGSGSGKTSCLAIPSLWTWKSPVFCIDIKGELYKKTSSVRKNIKVFDPLKADTWGYDPFFVLSKTDNQAQEAEAISISLIPLPPETKDEFWIHSARNMLTGFMLHFYNVGLSFVKTIEKIQSSDIGKLINDICDNTTTNEVKFYLNNFMYMDNKPLMSVYAELSRHIIIYATDKQIKSALSQDSKKNISPTLLEKGEDVYICIQEHLLRQWKQLLTLIISQFIRHFEKRSEETATPILFLLDEFPRLGKIEEIADVFATLRSKKITVCAIIQSLAQLDLIYGTSARRVIVDNCSFKAILNATDADSQEYFSRLVGTYDKPKTSTDKRYEPITGFPAGKGRHNTTEEKRIMKPEEFATLTDIVLFAPFGCVRAEKAWYFNYL